MDTDFLGDFFDHHGLELIDAPFEEILLARDNRIAHFHDRLLALLDVLDQLNGRFVALFHVIARVAIVTVSGEQPFVGGVQAQLGHVFVIHDDQPLVTMLDESDIGFDQSGGNLVVLKSRTRIEGADVVERGQDGLHRPPDRPANLFELLQSDCAQMLIHHRHRVFHDLLGGAVAVSMVLQLRQVIAQLIEQALTQVAASYPRGIELANDFQSLV